MVYPYHGEEVGGGWQGFIGRGRSSHVVMDPADPPPHRLIGVLHSDAGCVVYGADVVGEYDSALGME